MNLIWFNECLNNLTPCKIHIGPWIFIKYLNYKTSCGSLTNSVVVFWSPTSIGSFFNYEVSNRFSSLRVTKSKDTVWSCTCTFLSPLRYKSLLWGTYSTHVVTFKSLRVLLNLIFFFCRYYSCGVIVDEIICFIRKTICWYRLSLQSHDYIQT